jgi:hypothetical protein
VGERRQSRPLPRPPHLSVPLVELLPRSRRSITAKEPVWRVLSMLPAWALVVMICPPVVARDSTEVVSCPTQPDELIDALAPAPPYRAPG